MIDGSEKLNTFVGRALNFRFGIFIERRSKSYKEHNKFKIVKLLVLAGLKVFYKKHLKLTCSLLGAPGSISGRK